MTAPPEECEIIRINFSGKDRPGLVSQLTGVLAHYNANILDIGESVIHDYISLVMLIELPLQKPEADVLKDLLYAAHRFDLSVNFTPIPLDEYEDWVGDQRRERRMITMVGRKFTAEQISKVTAVIADQGLNIDVTTRLSGRPSIRNPRSLQRACIQFAIHGEPKDEDKIRRDLLQISKELGVDVSFQVDDIYRRSRRLVVFDMDSTLIQTEVIVELAKAAGVGQEVEEITEAAMRGELDFRQSLFKRVSLLKGLNESVMAEIAQSLPLSEGTERAAKTLKHLGYKVGIISGGFTYFGEYLKDKLDFDYAFANELEIADGKLTGHLVGDIIDAEQKAVILSQIAERENLSLKQTIAVGDGANDLNMLSVAGLGIAYHAKPIVQDQAEQAISNVGLDGLLYLIGVRDREIGG